MLHRPTDPSRFLQRVAAFHAMTKAACCPADERQCVEAVESEGVRFCKLGGECVRDRALSVIGGAE